MNKSFPLYTSKKFMIFNVTYSYHVLKKGINKQMPLCPSRSSGETVSNLSTNEWAAGEIGISKSTPAMVSSTKYNKMYS